MKNEYILHNDYIEIKTYNRIGTYKESFYIDNKDYNIIKNYKWYTTKNRKSKRVLTHFNNTNILLSRFILGINKHDKIIDHIDNNGLNNRRSNLRICNNSQNLHNISIPNINNSTGTRGIDYHKNTKKYRVRIKLNYKSYLIGYYKNKKDAILARLKSEKKYYGEFASKKKGGRYAKIINNNTCI